MNQFEPAKTDQTRGLAPAINPGRFLVWSNIICALFISAVLVFVVPVFAAMFADFGAKLPASTAVLIAASNFMKGWVWAFDPFLAVLMLPIAFLLPSGESQRAWLRVSGAVQIVVVLAIGEALFAPVFQLSAVASGIK